MILATHLTKEIHLNIHTLGVFIDFSKTFDTVNHKILEKLIYGITRIYSNWLESYLSNRKQFISLNDKSTMLP